MEWLKTLEPEEIWPQQTPQTDAEWIAAGEIVFDEPIGSAPGLGLGGRPPGSSNYLMDKSWYDHVRPPLTREGILPFYRYVVRRKGQIEIGILACAMCHTKVMPDGSIVKGAQGNFPFDEAMAEDLRSVPQPTKRVFDLQRSLYFAPWMNPEQLALIGNPDALEGRNPGSLTRHRSHPLYPIGVPDLIGLDHRRYLDRTGLQQYRGIADLMRYAALNQGGDNLSSYGGFVPVGGPEAGRARARYSDEQLYALCWYVLALKPPSNPNPLDELARREQKVLQVATLRPCIRITS
jgi:hypothetical protein